MHRYKRSLLHERISMMVGEKSPSPISLLHRGYWLRTHVHDLDSLAAFTSQSGVVVCSVFTEGHREMAANWMYALSRFGGVREALLFTFDEDSLRECLVLGFACYDGLMLMSEKSTLEGESIEKDIRGHRWMNVSHHDDKIISFCKLPVSAVIVFEHVTICPLMTAFSPPAAPVGTKLMWMKPVAMDALLKLNYTVLFRCECVWSQSCNFSSTSCPCLAFFIVCLLA